MQRLCDEEIQRLTLESEAKRVTLSAEREKRIRDKQLDAIFVRVTTPNRNLA